MKKKKKSYTSNAVWCPAVCLQQSALHLLVLSAQKLARFTEDCPGRNNFLELVCWKLTSHDCRGNRLPGRTICLVILLVGSLLVLGKKNAFKSSTCLNVFNFFYNFCKPKDIIELKYSVCF